MIFLHQVNGAVAVEVPKLSPASRGLATSPLPQCLRQDNEARRAIQTAADRLDIRDRLLERYMAYDHAIEDGDEKRAEAIKAEIASLLEQQEDGGEA
jgi:hypothetical protein